MSYKRKVMNSQKDLKIISKTKKEIFTKAKYGPSKITRIPLKLSEDLGFLSGVIIGDGHLKISKFQISIELTDRNLINHIKEIFRNLFERNFNVLPVKTRPGKKQSFTLRIDSKSIYKLFQEVFEIPPGKKSHIVRVPTFIFNSNGTIKLSFLRGIMATEGGKRRRGFGLSTASKQLWEELIILFENIEIPVLQDKWRHKKYKKDYYGIAFKAQYMPILMWECRSGQTGCV